MNRNGMPSAGGLLALIVVFELSAFLLLAFSKSPVDTTALWIGAAAAGVLVLQYCLLTGLFRQLDRYVLIIANLLSGIGFILIYRMSPEHAIKQLIFYLVGVGCMIAILVIVRKCTFFEDRIYIWMGIVLFLLSISLVFGKETYGAKNWIIIGPVSVQPSEFAKVALLFVMAGCLRQKTKLIRLWPLFVFICISLVLLVLMKDLGAALLFGITFLILFYVATGNLLVTGLCLLGAAGGSVVAYKLFDHVKVRVQMWKNPWLDVENKGYQIVQGLVAIASGGLLGLGLTKGSPNVIPASKSDYIFAVLCEEMGILIGVAVIAFYIILVVRGALIAVNAYSAYDSLLALGATSILTVQSFIIIAGVIKMIPLTGITLPFISYGGTSVVSCMALIGVLEGVALRNADRRRQELGVSDDGEDEAVVVEEFERRRDH